MVLTELEEEMLAGEHGRSMRKALVLPSSASL
jgi:predicted aconitase